MIGVMDAPTIDKEFEQLQAEFQDVATTVQGLAAKMQAAEKAETRTRRSGSPT